MTVGRSLVVAVFLMAAWQEPVRAEVGVPRIFGDRMVVQRDAPVRVWGWATPGEEVKVELAGRTASTTTGTDGRWRVVLEPLAAGGPHTLGIEGKNKLAFQQVMVGEVWLCAGQSNMEWPMDRTQYAGRDLPTSADPLLRLCKVDPIVAVHPERDCTASWNESNPGSAAKFSAVAWYLGRDLRKRLDVPVGVIMVAAGGTPIETWISAASCGQTPALTKIGRLVRQVADDYRSQSEANLDRWTARARAAIAAGENPPAFEPLPPIIIQRGWLPTGIFNGAIAPVAGFGVRGVAWYQGEANNGEGLFYTEKLAALIADWRQAWGQGEFPFVMTQIAPWSGYPEGNLEDIWDAQRAALAIPGTGLVTTGDLVPNLADIHPVQKAEVGERLGRWAAARVYGLEDGPATGPIPEKIAVRGDAVAIAFRNADGGLRTRDGTPAGLFQVGTAEGFFDAEASIDGATVIVRSGSVPRPEYVRYAWNKTAVPTLVNEAGLPALPFRSDAPAVRIRGATTFAGKNRVTLMAEPIAGTIRYTLDGSLPTPQSPAAPPAAATGTTGVGDGRHAATVELDRSATLTARLFPAAGGSSLPVSAAFVRVDPLLVDGARYAPGLNYEYFVGKWSSLPNFDALPVEQVGVAEKPAVTAAPVATQFALRFRGHLQVAKDGDYVFTAKSDDGSRVSLDGKVVVDDDGQHGATPKKSDPVRLRAGLHPLEVLYHESWGGSSLSLAYEGPDLPAQDIPATAYFHRLD